jgi:hypothetical protein
MKVEAEKYAQIREHAPLLLEALQMAFEWYKEPIRCNQCGCLCEEHAEKIDAVHDFMEKAIKRATL